MFLSLAGARLANAVFQALAMILLARLAGPGDFGTLSGIYAFQSVVLGVAVLGIPPFILRAYPRGEFEDIQAALRLNTITSIIAGVVALSLSALFVPKAFFLAVLFLAVAFTIEKNTEVQVATLVASGQKTLVVSTILVRALAPLLAVLVAMGAAFDVILAFAVGRSVGALASFLLAKYRSKRYIRVNPTPIKTLIRRLAPLAISNVFSTLKTLDTFVVLFLTTPSQAGLYASASRSFSPMLLMAEAAANVLMPKAAVMPDSGVKLYLRKVGLLVLCGMGVTAVITPFSDQLMSLVFGKGFEGSGGVLVWLLISIWPNIGCTVLNTVLQARNDDRFVAVVSSIGTVVLLLATAIGAVGYGAVGAASGLAIATWGRFLAICLRSRFIK